MRERVAVYRQLLAQTPVDELDVKEEPSVIFRVNENTWIDAIVRYLVIPKEQGRVKTRLIKEMLERFKAETRHVSQGRLAMNCGIGYGFYQRTLNES